MKKIFGWLIFLFIGLSFAIPMPGLCQNPVEILMTVDRLKFVGGQNIVLKTDIVFYQKINPFWEELAKTKFSPFILEKIILGERKIFDREKELTRDYREVTFLLSLPIDSKCGTYAIPAFSLNYSYFQGKSEIKNTAKSKAIKVEKVPILVTIVMAKDAITIGENNTIRLTIWREKFIHLLNQELKDQAGESQAPENEGFQRWLKSLEIRNQKITDLNKPDFRDGFKILDKKSWIKQQGSIITEVFEYRFAFYELGGKEFPLPRFHIWYLNKSEEGKIQKPKEIVTPPLVAQINLVVRPGRKMLEWLKPPEPNRKNNIYYFGYGPMALGGIFFLIFAISITVSCFRSRKKKVDSSTVSESPCEIKNRILSLLKSDELREKGTLIKTRNEFFKLFGSITGIPNNISMAKSTPQMLALIKNAGFSEDLIRDLKTCLESLEKSIYSSKMEDKPEKNFSEVWKQIDAILAKSEISRRFKRKKKFLFF